MRGVTGAIVLVILAAALAAAEGPPTAWLLVEADERGDAEVRLWFEPGFEAEAEIRWTGGSVALDPIEAAPSAYHGRVPSTILGPSSRLVVATSDGAFETGLLGAPPGSYTLVSFAPKAGDFRVEAPERAPLAPRAGTWPDPADPAPSVLLAGGALVATAYVLAVVVARRPEPRTDGTPRARRFLARPILGAEGEDLARFLETTWPDAEVGRAAAEGLRPRHAGDVLDAMSARGGVVAEIVAIRPRAMVLRVAGGCAYACGFLARAFESLAHGPVIVEETRCHAVGGGVPRKRLEPVVAGTHRRRWRPCEIVVHANLTGRP